ncbi:translocation/assembly module TamB domain-containing protein [Mesonia aquimarina]|uniref:translocation/assembly module TamB domain-containing protein n=1 Tax=Mesonia aquimarina TaxID=1504967 RepID=UPI001F08ACB7|nr:translocation/assembly module TamB domain-containing protein [Mesonia aquimarina]
MGRVLVAILLLFLILILVFSIPSVQTSVAEKITSQINQDYDVDINVERVSISYNGKIVLENVYIADHHQDTLISAQDLSTSLVNIPGMLSGKRLDFTNVTVDNLKLNIKMYKGEDQDNLSLFSDKFNDSTATQQNFILTIDHIIATNSRFRYIDENQDFSDIITLNNLDIDASNLLVEGKDFAIDVRTLNATEKQGLEIKNLSTKFSYTTKHMKFQELSLITPESKVKGDLQFSYENPQQLADFENKVALKANFSEVSIASKELNYYYNEFGKDEQITFNTKLEGTLNNLRLNELDLNGMDRTRIKGSLSLEQLFSENKDDILVSGNFDELATNYYDLTNLLPRVLGDQLPDKLQEIGNVNLSGFIEASPKKLTVKSTTNTQLGNAELDVTLGDLNDPDFATYQGNVIFKNFNIGRLVGVPSLGKATFNLKVDGVGFTEKTLNSSVEGKINKLNFNNYTYKNIDVLGVFDNLLFNGKLDINDPNLKLNFNGVVDASQKVNTYNFSADIAYADLHKLNFIERDTTSVFKGNLVMNMQGTSVNDAEGKIYLENASYQNPKNTYQFDELTVSSSFNENVRKITVNSPDIIDGEMEGDFKLTEIPELFQNALGSLYTNYKPIPIESYQYLDFNFNIYNKIVDVIFPDIELAPNTFVKGSIVSEESEFKLTFRSPKINAFDNVLDDVTLQVDNNNPLYNTYLEIDSVNTGVYNFSKFNLINVKLNDTLFMRTEMLGGADNDDEYNLSFYHTLNKNNKSVVGIRKSDIKFKDKRWYLNKENRPNNTIVFDNDFRNFNLDTLTLSHKNEAIRLSGVMRDSTYKNFKLDFLNVDLAKITPSLDSIDLSGTVNGKLNFLQEDGIYKPTSSLKINDIALNDISYGNLNLDIKGNKSLTTYNVKALLGNKTYDFLKANGAIDIKSSGSTIDLDVALDKFKLDALSALGADVITNIRGTASGNAKINGSYKNPDITGKLSLENAGLKIPYLNVDLDFQDKAIVNLTEQQFNFDEIPIVDTKYKTEGTLNGTISHNNFSKWELDLTLNAPDRLLVLDTDQEENSLYYGTAFISGGATIKGPTDELVIDVNAKTEEGTIFKIPLSDTETIGDNSFIYFLTPEEKKALQEGKEIKIKEVKGLELFFELDVTSDAEVEVVVDQNSGSTLRGSGAGTLLIEINTNGKFNMWGDFVVYEGVYNFKYAGLVEKKFEVISGGNITWDGSPTRANLNVSALYKTEANPAILLENPTINRNIPVEVYIDLTGELTSTDLEFNIEYPNLSSVVKSELQYRISDRQNTELQALSLITQSSFYSQYTVGQNAGSLLFERASGLFDDIFSDEDGKFKVGINYVQGDRTPDQDTADRFGVTLSTQISKRILINGRVGVPIGGVTESVVVGNVEVELLLNKEGTLRAKVFNRENNIQYIGEELGYTQGVGLSYSVDFDTFRELIRKILNKEIKVEELPEKVEDNDQQSLAPDYINFPGS